MPQLHWIHEGFQVVHSLVHCQLLVLLHTTTIRVHNGTIYCIASYKRLIAFDEIKRRTQNGRSFSFKSARVMSPRRDISEHSHQRCPMASVHIRMRVHYCSCALDGADENSPCLCTVSEEARQYDYNGLWLWDPRNQAMPQASKGLVSVMSDR